MKKLFILLLSCSFISFAQAKDLLDLFNNHPDFIDDELHKTLCKKDFEKDYSEIYNGSLGLTIEEKQELFDIYKLKANYAISDNFGAIFPAFGKGSFFEKDVAGGTILLISGIIGWGAIGVSGICLSSPLLIGIIPIINLYFLQDDLPERMIKIGLISGGIGLGVLLVEAVIAIVRPIVYSKHKNNALMKALGLSEEESGLTLAPLLNPAQSEYGLIAKIRL